MDFIASIIVEPVEALKVMAQRVGNAIGLKFSQDLSGYYEEFPAFTAQALGVEFALLGLPDTEDQDAEQPVEEYALLVRSIIEASDDEMEVDISIHLHALLHSASIRCRVETV